MFANLESPAPDPILGLQSVYNADPRSQASGEKINLSIGVYCDESGNTPIMAAVKSAERQRNLEERSKKYLAVQGTSGYRQVAAELALGSEHDLLVEQRLAVLATPGGTGAFRVACEFLAQLPKAGCVWISDPGWANHAEICARAGLQVKRYRYYDNAKHQIYFAAMLEDLAAAQPGDAVLVHNCCHNPSGADLTPGQWQHLAQELRARDLLPLIDNAYQGFGDGFIPDRRGLLEIAQHCPEFIACISHSKNFGLYRERIGALLMGCADSEHCEAVLANLSSLARANYSMPPAHGAYLVQHICNSTELYQQWADELDQIQARISSIRSALAEGLKAQLGCHDFDYIKRDKGMFSLLGITPEQVERLRVEYGFYILKSSRTNLAGLSLASVPRLVDGLVAVL